PGTDALLVSGTGATDNISVSQSGNVLSATVNGVNGTNAPLPNQTFSGVEQVALDVTPGTDVVTIFPLSFPVRVRATPAQDANQQYINSAYVKFLGRLAGPADFSFWVPVLTSQSRDAVSNGIARSQEAATFTVRNFFRTFLGREADSAALAFHVQ